MARSDKQYETRTDKQKARTKRLMAKHRALVSAIKLEQGCIDCGYNAYACALDFDHRDPTLKRAAVSYLVRKSWNTVLAEIAKCDVRCANCHRVKTKGHDL